MRDLGAVSGCICLVSGVSSFAVAESMCAIFPTCVPLPVPVMITTPLPGVTGVCAWQFIASADRGHHPQ